MLDSVFLHRRFGTLNTELDLSGKHVHDDHGNTHTFDKLLLATGGTTRRLPFGGDDVIYHGATSSCSSCHTALSRPIVLADKPGAFRSQSRWRSGLANKRLCFAAENPRVVEREQCDARMSLVDLR